MKYPDSVLTKNKKGELEVRNLLKRGRFVEYNYIDPETGEPKEGGKKSIVLKSGDTEEHYFLVPLKGEGRFLAILHREKKTRKLWNGKRDVGMWD